MCVFVSRLSDIGQRRRGSGRGQHSRHFRKQKRKENGNQETENVSSINHDRDVITVTRMSGSKLKLRETRSARSGLGIHIARSPCDVTPDPLVSRTMAFVNTKLCFLQDSRADGGR